MANVRLTDDLRKRVGSLLSGYVNAGESQIGQAKLWWEVCRSFHRNDPTGYVGTKEDPGYEVFHTPLSQPRQDALTAQVCTTVGKQEPYTLDVSDEQSVAEGKQKLVHRLWSEAGFEANIRLAAAEASNTDNAFYRVCPLGDSAIEMTVHSADEVVVFPALPAGVEACTAVGHKVWKRRRDIVAAQDAKAYYEPLDEQKLPSGNEHTGDGVRGASVRAGVTEVAGPLANLDALVELWDLVVWLDLDKLRAEDDERDGKKAQWYRATVCRDATEVLALEPYPYSRPWYFRSRFVGSIDFYSPTSVARNLLPLQRQWNNLNSALYAGLMAGFAVPIYGPALGNEKATKYGWFEYIETDSPVQPWSPTVRPQVAPVPIALTMIERNADKVARISQNTAGGDSPDQTATEASIVASGVAVGLEEYVSNFTMEFPAMAAFTLELVSDNPMAYAQRTGIEFDPAPCQWTTKGQSPTHSPQAIVQAVQPLLEIALNPNPAVVIASGLQLPEIIRTYIENSALQNADGIQLSREEIALRNAPGLATGGLDPMVAAAGGAIAPGGAEAAAGGGAEEAVVPPGG